MPNKPGFFGEHIWSAFQDPSVVRAYKHRPLYTPQAIQHVASLCVGTPRRVLDLGCGSGNVCRDLAPLVDEIDAVDASSAMIEEGRRLPNGNDPKIRWIVGRVESAPLNPPYALATAGSSIHWMDWDVLFPLLSRVLTPGASLAILQNKLGDVPWHKELGELTPRFTVNKEKVPYNVLEELEQRGLFTVSEKLTTDAVPFEQTADDYIEGLHSRSMFSRERMGTEMAAAFDAEMRRAIERYAPLDRPLSLAIRTNVVWGLPHSPPEKSSGG